MTDFSDLVAGYGRFRETGWAEERDRWAKLAEGQSPKVLVIACSDSRADPATVFDTSPGEIFVVRNVANLVPPYETGGGRHGSCGGVHASLTRGFADAKPGEGGFIAHWIDLLDEARDRVEAEHGTGAAAVKALELETVRVSIANLRTFPFVQREEAAGRLTLRGAWFSIKEGVLWVMGADGEFRSA